MANDVRWVNRAWSRPPFKGWPEKFNAVVAELEVACGRWAVNGPLLVSDYDRFYDAAWKAAANRNGGAATRGMMLRALRGFRYFRDEAGRPLVTVSRFPWYYLGWT